MKKYMWIIITAAAILLFGFFIYRTFASRRADVSTDPRFSVFVGKDFVLKRNSRLEKLEEHMYRFRNISLTDYYLPDKNEDTVQSLSTIKILSPGSSVHFTEARLYYSFFIGESFYLMGYFEEKGERTEFEYDYSERSPFLWESDEDYYPRIEAIRAAEEKSM